MAILNTTPHCRLLDTGPLTAAENMALDEIILEEVAAGRSPLTMRFLQFDPPAVLVGHRQDVDREVRLDFCRQNGIDVNRRITGGGAIYFQSSALGWELFGPAGRGPFRGPYEQVLTSIGQAGAQALGLLGLPAAFRPRNDIEVDGRKVSGTGGAALERGLMFQGTLLIKNEMELFLKSLRVPVEKLKKRELESLQQRVCFLNDLMQPLPPLDRIKSAFVQAVSLAFRLDFEPAGLTSAEQASLKTRLDYFSSDDWIFQKSRRLNTAHDHWSLHQTDGGTLRVHFWLEPGQRVIRQALVTGDFFCRPSRFVLDLEAALKGVKADDSALARAVAEFFRTHDGEFLGFGPAEITEALTKVVRRMDLAKVGLDPAEANELFLINISPSELHQNPPTWLLLPYCSKKVDCGFRNIPDCGRCGECQFDEMYALAEEHGLEVYSIQSFEHLAEVLNDIGHDHGRPFVGSCCEAFYAKHQLEMEASGARGVLVNLNSTTCYDLGKGMEAYHGQYDHQTFMNGPLIMKVIRMLHG
jgi:lipoate-protein ligase A